MKQKAIEAMKKYYGETERSIIHTLRVLEYAEMIMAGENVTGPFTLEVAVLAAVFHDVGIPEALRKYGTSAARYQEQEGGPIARDLMTSIGVRPDILERVCYIVAHHHTREFIDGPDFQVVWDADALVNIPARQAASGHPMTPAELDSTIAATFATATGNRLIRQVM